MDETLAALIAQLNGINTALDRLCVALEEQNRNVRALSGMSDSDPELRVISSQGRNKHGDED